MEAPILPLETMLGQPFSGSRMHIQVKQCYTEYKTLKRGDCALQKGSRSSPVLLLLHPSVQVRVFNEGFIDQPVDCVEFLKHCACRTSYSNAVT